MNASPGFYGHETFPFRNGWLKKGISALLGTPNFFTQDRAMIVLGVGKNMVRSIRHWGLAARIFEEANGPGSRGGLRETEFGRRLFLDPGYDSYLEDPATLWLIHWQLASNIRVAAMWYWVFSYWNVVEFTKTALVKEVEAWIIKEGFKAISVNSLRRDADCFVRTYVHSKRNRNEVISEDTLDCPLVDLHLIEELADGKTYRFLRGPQSTLPDEILAFALIEFWNSQGSTASSLAFEKIAFEPGSPGKIFKIDEDSLASRLEKIDIISGGTLAYDETGGLKQIYKLVDQEIDPLRFLDSYYLKSHATTQPSAD
jgi:hypothetical protein